MRKLIYLTVLSILLMGCKPSVKYDGQFLINHIGYQKNAFKSAVLQSNATRTPSSFLIENERGEKVYEGEFLPGGAIDGWHTGNAYKAVFSDFCQSGTFTLVATTGTHTVRSEPFEISGEPLASELMTLLVKAFQLQRCVAPYNTVDKKMTFYGERMDTVDVSGGWYDASGEKGKYLSHLSFSNYMTPQQLPMMVWNMLEAADVLKGGQFNNWQPLIAELSDEAAYGADYLVRVQDDEGYFYATVFAGWTKDPAQRQICAYEGQDGKRNERYQAAFREGGGMAIAALARCYKAKLSGEFARDTYLNAAVKGYSHLKNHNKKYCDDGQENIIDDYCALLAATELYRATENKMYLNDARDRAANLVSRLVPHENGGSWLRADNEGKRPYFHGAEAGLPVLAMAHYIALETDSQRVETARHFISEALNFELWVTNEVNNPFGYARQLVKASDEVDVRTAFFIPHQNETGYWWQGENARIASLATAAFKAQGVLSEAMQSETRQYAIDQINWVLGLNPYDVCMLHGAGRNNPDYKEDGKSMNYLGGICNGITAGFTDEHDIAFRPLPYDEDPAQRWRWSEQWLQHGGWMIPALAYLSVQKAEEPE
ncbi:glycoside hydrolase family 9 protein [Carboxylicivirga taeanensis]|uniref:glycoside hydrolase family 9 protein n=1 Tax=Carboxylicivirga taeanensis TaxID=1416875 RepID=UPI003F6DDE95